MSDETISTTLRMLRDGRVWEALDARPAPSRVVRSFAEMVLDENDAAAAHLEDIATGPRAWWPQRLRKTHGAITAGMVRELLRHSRAVLDRSPLDALQLTSMAVEAADELRPDDYPYEIVRRSRGQALRDHAYNHAFLGRYREALEWVEQAETAFAGLPFAEFDAARLDLVKAMALQVQNRSQEAAELARRAGETFRRFDDRGRYLNARMTEAAMVYDGGDVARAFAVWTAIHGEPDADALTKLRCDLNIAVCQRDLGRPHEAVEPLRRAIGRFAEIGLSTEATRARWGLGTVFLATGAVEEAITTMRTAWMEFAEMGMFVDAALTGLDLSEALLAAGRPEQIAPICRDAIVHFTTAGVHSRAAAALALLSEASEAGRASRAMVRETHATVKRVVREDRACA
jgi:tetratricopeptide (TPR) repeat protein